MAKVRPPEQVGGARRGPSPRPRTPAPAHAAIVGRAAMLRPARRSARPGPPATAWVCVSCQGRPSAARRAAWCASWTSVSATVTAATARIAAVDEPGCGKQPGEERCGEDDRDDQEAGDPDVVLARRARAGSCSSAGRARARAAVGPAARPRTTVAIGAASSAKRPERPERGVVLVRGALDPRRDRRRGCASSASTSAGASSGRATATLLSAASRRPAACAVPGQPRAAPAGDARDGEARRPSSSR